MSNRDKQLLKAALQYFADLNGSRWINGNGPGEVDMRQRAQSLQRALYKHLYQE